MSCPSESAVAGFLERRLSRQRRAEIAMHVEGCTACRRLVVELSSELQLASTDAHATHPMRTPCHGETLANGTIVGRFVVLDLLGRGGMGVVYMAYDPDLDRKVALKLLHPGARSGDDPGAQLATEAQLMARVSHTNVIAIYDIGRYRDQVFAAMELVEGTTLRIWMEEPGRRPWREVVDVLLRAGEGLAAAHAANIVHRDFKPENVLIGRDGGVKVSDFGLAAPPSSTRHPVAGTPGYLPVEALQTGVIDECGDQFSFCVAFYETLHGHRPFRAQSLDELVAEVRRGPAPEGRRCRVPPRLSRVIRRGLALSPEQRYPSMHALLADARHAVATHRRRRLMTASVGAVGFAAVLGAIAITSDTHATVERPVICETDPHAEMGRAWFSALRARLIQQFAGIASIGDELDRFAARWTDDYAHACASPRSTRTFAKLACLLGERDEMSGITEMVQSLSPSIVADIDIGAMLPNVHACDGESPLVLPALPDDPVTRDKIRRLRPRILRAQFAPPAQALAEMPGMLGEAEALGWDPLIAEAHEGFGIAAGRAGGRSELARDHYKQASEIAQRSHHYTLAAHISIGRVISELSAASEPADPDAFAHLCAQARAAVHAASDHPLYAAYLAYAEGAALDSIQPRLDDAIASLGAARNIALSTHDLRFAMWIACEMARMLAARNRVGDLDAAWEMLVDTERIATAARFSDDKLVVLKQRLQVIAMLRGDLAAVHEWSDREGAPASTSGAVAMRGRVVDVHGNPVSAATVVAWVGILDGDATRAYRRAPRGRLPVSYEDSAPPGYQEETFQAHVAITDAEGRFSVQAVPDGGIIAELGGLRSRPRVIGNGPIVLRLEPTRTIVGTVTAEHAVPPGIAITARYQLGRTLAWDCTAALGRSHDYQIAGLPSGRASLRLDNWLGRPRKLELGRMRDGAELRWPVGPTLDVIVRGGSPRTPWIYLLRGHALARTTAELDRLVDRAAVATVNPAVVVGVANMSVEGTRYYQRNDRHRPLFDTAPGQVTVCVAEAAPTSTATCQTIEVPEIAPEIRDGQTRYPAIPIIFQR